MSGANVNAMRMRTRRARFAAHRTPAGFVGMLIAVFFAASAFAQPASPVPDQAPAESAHIGVFGDSLADGLWVGLRWHLRGDGRIAGIEQLSEVSTGIANWVYRDVSETMAEQLARARYDIAVVMIGSNDMQGIRAEDGTVHRFRSPGWEAVYRGRVRTLIAQLHDHGAQVIWTGLPVMRSARYDANVRHLNTIFEEEAEAAGAVYVSTRAPSSDANGAYSGYLEDAAGVPRLMRADDGIHFTLPGYRRIAGPVADLVDAALVDPELGAPRRATAGAERYEGLIELFIEGEAYICTPASEAELDAALNPEARRSRE